MILLCVACLAEPLELAAMLLVQLVAAHVPAPALALEGVLELLEPRLQPPDLASTAHQDVKHPTNGLRGLPSRIWVWGWGHWAPRTWVSRTDLPTSRTATDRNCSDVVKRRSRPPNPARWAPKQEGLATATAQTASKGTSAQQNHFAGPESEKG